MEELFARIWENLSFRITGPMWLRLVLQPTMATIFAVRAAISDARAGNPGYFWAIVTNKGEHRRELIKEGWASIAKIFFMAVLMDTIYQFVVQGYIYPGEILIVAFILAVVPYVLIRGPVNRLISGYKWGKQKVAVRRGSRSSE